MCTLIFFPYLAFVFKVRDLHHSFAKEKRVFCKKTKTMDAASLDRHMYPFKSIAVSQLMIKPDRHTSSFSFPKIQRPSKRNEYSSKSIIRERIVCDTERERESCLISVE